MRCYSISCTLTSKKTNRKIAVDFPVTEKDLNDGFSDYKLTDWHFKGIPDLELAGYGIGDINDLMDAIDLFNDNEIELINFICEKNQEYDFMDFVFKCYDLRDFQFYYDLLKYEKLGILPLI